MKKGLKNKARVYEAENGSFFRYIAILSNT